jgi:hypothetical protein
MMRVLHLRPHPSAQEKGGRPVRPRKNSAREKVFVRPRSAYRAFPCGNRRLASVARTEVHRKILRAMARAWTKVAEEAEQRETQS